MITTNNNMNILCLGTQLLDSRLSNICVIWLLYFIPFCFVKYNAVPL